MLVGIDHCWKNRWEKHKFPTAFWRAVYRTLHFIDLLLQQYHIYIAELYQGVSVEGFRKKKTKTQQQKSGQLRMIDSIPSFSYSLNTCFLERYFSAISYFICFQFGF